MEVRRELHWDRLVNCFSDRAPNLWQRIATVLAERGEAIAVVYGDTRLSYDDLDAQSGGAAALLAELGVEQGDRVAVMLSNSADAIRALLAVIRIGAVLVPVGTRSKAAELSYIFADADPRVVIHGAEFSAEMPADGLAADQRIDVSGEAWQSAVRLGTAAPAMPDLDEHALFGILYTSGTTGKPKGAMLTHLNVLHSCLHWQRAHGLTAEDRTLLCVPWAHVSGLCGVVVPFLSIGARIIILGEFKRRSALKMASAERITHALMVPAMYGLCLLEPDLAAFDLKTWRIAAYGGAPMPEPTIARFAEAFPDLAMCNCYGATETTSPATIMPPGEGTARSDSIGRVVECGDIRVMDERGHEVEAGTDGEFWIGGPMVTPGYWRNPEATAPAFAGGYWMSGDIGSIDRDGYVRIADRKKDMIVRGGYKVYPAEVESVIAGLQGVVEAAVVGCPDEMLGEGVVAFVCVADSSVCSNTVRQWCQDQLSDYKVPAVIVVDPTPLPRNVNGKIQKADLRKRAVSYAIKARVS